MMSKQPVYETKNNTDQMAKPITDWPKEPSVMDLNADLMMARPGRDKTVQRVTKWLALKEAKQPIQKNKKGRVRSSIQPKLVRRTAEWRYPALSEPFLSGEETWKVSPTTFEDVDGARKNQLVLNYQFRTKMNSVKFIDDYVRACVDEGTAIVKVGWIRETRKVEKVVPTWTFYQDETPENVELLGQALQLMNENPQGFEELPAEIQEAARYSLEKGIPVVAVISGSTKIKEEVIVKNHPTLTIVNFANIYIDPSCEGDISKANFAVMSFETSKAELLKDGRYKNLDQVNWGSESPHMQPEHVSASDNVIQFKDELRRRVVAYEYWGFYDVMGDDNLVPIVATWIGGTMIRMEENPFPDQAIPFVVVPYLPEKDSVTGETDAELLEENQAVLGALMRGIIDTMGRSASGQTGYAKGVLDPVNERKFLDGEDYQFNPGMNPDVILYQHRFPEIPASALNMLTIQNQEAEAISGVKAFSGGLSSEAFGDVAAGMRGMLDAQGKREMSILRRLCQGMEEIGRKIIAMNGVFLSEDEFVQVTNEEFVQVSREDLQGEFNTKVEIATAEVDANRAADLGFLLQTMGPTMPFELVKMILIEIVRLKRMPHLARQLEKYEPQPDPLEQAKKELEIAELQAKTAELQARAAMNQAKARAIASEADLKDLDFLEQETGTKHARDMEKIQTQAESNQMRDITKRVLDPENQISKPYDVDNALRLHSLAQGTV